MLSKRQNLWLKIFANFLLPNKDWIVEVLEIFSFKYFSKKKNGAIDFLRGCPQSICHGQDVKFPPRKKVIVSLTFSVQICLIFF